MVKRVQRAPKLPKRQLLILSICRFAEPVAMTSVFPYLPEMIQSFGVPTDQVAKWAGLMSAVFSLSQCLTGIIWGRASDRYGRKPVIIIGLICTMIGTVLFGFSRSLLWAFLVRSLQGLSNGNVGIIRTTVAELVPEKELQPRAFSIMPLVWTIGSIFGPAFGGALVYPVKRFPWLVGHSKLLTQYPFAFPNLLISIFFLVGISTGILFLRESLEDKKDRKDYGLMVGSLLTKSCSKRRKTPNWRDQDGEADPFLLRRDSEVSEMASPVAKVSHKPLVKAQGWAEVFSPQSNVNLAVYTLLAMHSVAFDQLLPIFMHHPSQSSHDPRVHLPLKFSGGFGIDSSRIGVLFTIYGITGMFIQFAIFPPFARKYGVLNCLKACVLTFPLIYIATPFTALLPTNSSRQGVMMILMLFKGWCAIFSFPCSTILLTNSAASLKVLGTLNGVATSISAIGRAAGPALTGSTFTVGVNVGYMVVPWWTLSAVAIVGAIPVFWLIEMEGFGSSEDSNDSSDLEDDDDQDDSIAEADLSRGSITRLDAPMIVATQPVDEPSVVPEEAVDLTQTVSRSSQPRQRRESHNLRRIPSPIGMGPGVTPAGARRYSSELGATRSGLGVGGTSYN